MMSLATQRKSLSESVGALQRKIYLNKKEHHYNRCMEERLEKLKDELKFEKKRNTRLAHELEGSEFRLMDLLEKIRELENSTVKEL
jgi:hypothetical protein